MRVAVVGLGVIGASFALGLKEKGYIIYGVDKDEETIKYALDNNIINYGSTKLDDYLDLADLVLFCVYPRTILKYLKEYSFKENQILSDVSGVKKLLIDEINKLDLKAKYVSIHPMAGREKKGIMYADKDRFINANYLIVPTKFSDDESINVLSQIGKDLGFGIISTISSEYHDLMISNTSQLPHALAVALMLASDDDNTVKFIGDSYRDLTRIAMINEELWSELFLENKDNLLKSIEMFEQKLDNIKDCLKNNQIDDLKDMFRSSSKKRELMNKEKVAK